MACSLQKAGATISMSASIASMFSSVHCAARSRSPASGSCSIPSAALDILFAAKHVEGPHFHLAPLDHTVWRGLLLRLGPVRRKHVDVPEKHPEERKAS